MPKGQNIDGVAVLLLSGGTNPDEAFAQCPRGTIAWQHRKPEKAVDRLEWWKGKLTRMGERTFVTTSGDSCLVGTIRQTDSRDRRSAPTTSLSRRTTSSHAFVRTTSSSSTCASTRPSGSAGADLPVSSRSSTRSTPIRCRTSVGKRVPPSCARSSSSRRGSCGRGSDWTGEDDYLDRPYGVESRISGTRSPSRSSQPKSFGSVMRGRYDGVIPPHEDVQSCVPGQPQ